MCNDWKRLEAYRKKLLMAIQHEKNYPMETELPEIYVTKNREIDLGEEFGEPYYSEIDIDFITSTNTSSSGVVYSNYDRVIGAMKHIKEKKCKPISVLKVGDDYYIDDGKHRFLAYTLLGEKTIPVSIREKSFSEFEKSYNIVEYKRNLYSDDGTKISYPEQAIEFMEKNVDLFKNIVRVEMVCLEEQKRYSLKLIKENGDIIEFKNGISAGNDFRSSEVTKEILSRCNYDINMEFIKNNSEFILEDYYDAHNIIFDINVTLNERTRQYIMEKLDTIQYYQFGSWKTEDKKIDKLHGFIVKYEPFKTISHTMDNSGSIYDNENVYYLVGSDSKMGEENYIYVFNEKKIQESNLNIKYLGRIGKEDDLYVRISSKK